MMTEPIEEEFIEVVGARSHNLKDLTISIPRNKLVVITGLSGSGKSSLAARMETVVAAVQAVILSPRQFWVGLSSASLTRSLLKPTFASARVSPRPRPRADDTDRPGSTEVPGSNGGIASGIASDRQWLDLLGHDVDDRTLPFDPASDQQSRGATRHLAIALPTADGHHDVHQAGFVFHPDERRARCRRRTLPVSHHPADQHFGSMIDG